MNTSSPELLKEQALMVLATLAQTNAATLYALAEGLRQADGPASRFAVPIYYLAGNRERGELPDGLAEITMRSALRNATCDSAFVDQLDHADSPFWRAVRDALVAIDEEMQPATAWARRGE